MIISEADRENFFSWINVDKTLGFKSEKIDLFNAFVDDAFPPNSHVKMVGKKFEHIKHQLEKYRNQDFIYFETLLIIFLFQKKESQLEFLCDAFGVQLEDCLTRMFIIFQHLRIFQNSEKLFLANPQTTISEIDQKIRNIDLNQILTSDFFDLVSLIEHLDKNNLIPNTRPDGHHKQYSLSEIPNYFSKKQNLILFFSILLTLSLVWVVQKVYFEGLKIELSSNEPNFIWLDKSLRFQNTAQRKEKLTSLASNQIEKLLENESQIDFISDDPTRIGPESEVILTSMNEIMKGFSSAGSETSEYEEDSKGGFRDRSNSRTRVYRIIINSEQVKSISQKIKDKIVQFKAKKIDKVEPGQEVPGGIYFNLQVPKNNIEEFLSFLSKINQQTSVYISKNNRGVIPKHDRVFVWLKTI